MAGSDRVSNSWRAELPIAILDGVICRCAPRRSQDAMSGAREMRRRIQIRVSKTGGLPPVERERIE